MYNYTACVDLWNEYFILHKTEEITYGCFKGNKGNFRYTKIV